MALLGLISDVHANPGPVAEALLIFRKNGVDSILCAGDVAGYGDQLDETVNLLLESGCTTILGNHELSYLDTVERSAESTAARYFERLPPSLDITIEGKRLYMVHAEPPYSCRDGIKLLNQHHGGVQADQKAQWAECLKTYDYDVLVVGHTHQVFAEKLGRILVVNPGSTSFNHTCMILRIPQLMVEIFALSNKTPIMAWNWGNQVN